MTDQKAVVIDSNQLPEETFEWGTLKWLCNAKLSSGAAQTLGLCHIWAGKRNPRHFHPNSEEVLFMLEGTGQHSFDDEMLELHRGSVIRIPAGVRHNLNNSGAETIVCLICFSSGDRETVFLE